MRALLGTTFAVSAVAGAALVVCYAMGLLSPRPEESVAVSNVILGPLGPFVWVGEIGGVAEARGFFILLFVAEFFVTVLVVSLLRRFAHVVAALVVGVVLWAAIGWVNHQIFFFG
jgi:hypothetical protein